MISVQEAIASLLDSSSLLVGSRALRLAGGRLQESGA